MDDAPVPLGGWTPLIDLDEPSGPTGSAAVAAAAGGLATWLPDGRWSTPAELDTPPPPEPPRRFRRRPAPAASPPRHSAGTPRQPGARPRAAAGPDERPASQAGSIRRPTTPDAAAGSGRRVAGDGGSADLVRGRRRLRVVRALAGLSGWPRRVAASAFAMAAVLLMLRPAPPEPAAVAAEVTVPVVVAAGDLPAGTKVGPAMVRTAAVPTGLVPSGAVREARAVVGRIVAGPVRRGEPLTDARLLGPGLTAGLSGAETTAAPVRLADPDSASLVRPGDRVDVLGTPVQPDGGPARRDAVTLATAVRVLAVVRGDDAADGVLLVVAVAPAVSRTLAGAAAGHRLTVAVRPP